MPRLLASEPPLRDADLRGQPTLINVWATWCTGCRREHDLLLALAGDGVDLVGINWRDAPELARRYLERLGNPYQQTAVDADGRIAAALGVRGAPETLLLDRHGRVIERHVGPMNRSVWQERFAAAMRKP